jgi:quinol monooxygenase YgiN
MPEPVIAIVAAAVKRGREKEFEALVRELFVLVRRKGYGNDRLLRSLKPGNIYFDIRDWASLEAAERAHRDPEIHTFWAKLDKVCRIRHIVGAAREVKL